MAITAYGLARAAMDIPAGRLVWRFGRRSVLIAAPAMVAVSALGCGLADAYWQLIAWRLLQGAGSAAFSVAALIVLGEISTPSNRGLYISFFWSTFLVGATLGPSFGGFLGEYFGCRTPFFVYAGLAIIATGWGYLRLPETKPPAHRPAAKKQISADLIKNKDFLFISLVALFNLLTIGGTQTTLIPLLGYERLQLSAGQVGLALTLVAIMQLILTPLAGRLSDRLGRKILIVPGGILTALGLVVFLLAEGYTFFLVSGLLLGFGRGLGGPVPTAYVADIAPQGNYENTLAAFRALSDLGWVIGPLLCGGLKDFYGIDFPFYLTAGLLALIVVLFGFFARETVKN
jgi:MFS family permease